MTEGKHIGIAFKRIEQVKKELERKLKTIADQTNVQIKGIMKDVHQNRVESLAANRNSSNTRHFLYEKGIMDKKEYIEFSEKSPLAQTYQREINLLQELIEEIESVDHNSLRELDFLKQKNDVRSVELGQIQIDRLKLSVEEIEGIKGLETHVEKLNDLISKMEKDHKILFESVRKGTPEEENEYYSKKEDAEEKINKYLDEKKAKIIDQYRQLPIYDGSFHLEIYIKDLLNEATLMYSFGCFNSCIICCCVIIEAALKDVIKYKEKKKEVLLEFSDLIEHCKKKDYVDDAEVAFLKDVKDTYRNPYVHANLETIIPKVITPGVQLSGHKVSDLKIISTEDAPVIRQLVRGKVDKKRALHLYKETIKFLGRISKKNYDF